MEAESLVSNQEVRSLVDQGCKAQRQLARYGTEQIAIIVSAMVDAVRNAIEHLSRLEVGETGRGNVESKMARTCFVLDHIVDDMKQIKCHGIVGHEAERKLFEIAVPLGLIAAVLPICAPTSTAIFKAILAVNNRNCIVFAAPEGTMRCVQETIRILTSAAQEKGAPVGTLSCFTYTDEVSLEHLMAAREIDFILATSTSSVANLANRSGKPNISVTESNTPVYIDHNASVIHAVRCILTSREFDFGMAYGSEEFILVHQSLYGQTLDEFKKQRAHLLSDKEATMLLQLLSHPDVLVGHSAHQISRMAGFSISPDARALILPIESDTVCDVLYQPKCAPILPVYPVKNWEIACEKCLDILHMAGKGHTLVVHTIDSDIIMEFGVQIPAARILVNAPATQGVMGWATGLVASLTLGTGSQSGCITTDNIATRHFFQTKKVTTLHDDFPLWGDDVRVSSNLIQLNIEEDVAKPSGKAIPWNYFSPPRPQISGGITPSVPNANVNTKPVFSISPTVPSPPPLSSNRQTWPRKK